MTFKLFKKKEQKKNLTKEDLVLDTCELCAGGVLSFIALYRNCSALKTIYF